VNKITAFVKIVHDFRAYRQRLSILCAAEIFNSMMKIENRKGGSVDQWLAVTLNFQNGIVDALKLDDSQISFGRMNVDRHFQTLALSRKLFVLARIETSHIGN
jgi:hypothetical protein